MVLTSKSVSPRRHRWLVGCLSLSAGIVLVTASESTARAQLGMGPAYQAQMRAQHYNRVSQMQNHAAQAAAARWTRIQSQRLSAINSGRSPRYSVWQPRWRARIGWGRRFR